MQEQNIIVNREAELKSEVRGTGKRINSFIEKNKPNICQIVACKDNQIVYSDTKVLG